MQRSKVKKCLLVLLLSLSMAFTMVPGGVLAEGNDNDNSEGVNVEENEGGDAVLQGYPMRLQKMRKRRRMQMRETQSGIRLS